MSASSYDMISGADVELGTMSKRRLGLSKRNKTHRVPPKSPSRKIQELWPEFVATALTDHRFADDVQRDVRLMTFHQAELTGQTQILNQSFSSVADLRRSLAAPIDSSLKTRLILLSDFKAANLARLTQYVELDTNLLAQLRSLAGVVVALGYGVDDCPADEFVRLSGCSDSVSGAGHILDALSSLKSPIRAQPDWSLRFIDATAPPVKFKSDLALYTSTFHTEPPARSSIRVCAGRKSFGGRNVTDLIVTCNDIAMGTAITSKFNSGKLDIHNIPFGDPRLVLLQLQALSDHQIIESVASIAESVFDAKFLVRRDPSWQKMNLLLHLRDHLEDVQQCLHTRLESSSEKKPMDNAANDLVPPSTFPQSCSQSPEIYLKLEEITKSLQAEIQSTHDALKDQLDSKDSIKNKLLAVLAAIYLPFTLASGVLGMNVKGLADDTDIKWPLYLAIGLPLALATVALPLSFERIYRGVKGFGTRNPVALRRLVRWIIPIFFATLVIVVIIVVALEVTKR